MDNRLSRTLASLLALLTTAAPAATAHAETWAEVSTTDQSCIHIQFLDDRMGFKTAEGPTALPGHGP